MKNYHRSRASYLYASVALTMLCASPLTAGEITGFVGVFGDGFVLVDEDENVVAPGLKPVTVAPNNDDRTSANGFSPSSGPGVTELDYNCIMASNDLVCDAPPGDGKRYKTNLTGRGPLDLAFATSNSGGVTEYFNFGKTTNQTDARLLGFDMQLGTGTGTDFVVMDTALAPEAGVFFDQLVPLSARALEWPGLDGATEGQNPLQRIFFPGGLFGSGGQEGEIGFFTAVPDGLTSAEIDDFLTAASSGFVAVPSADLTAIDASFLFGAEHLALFGDGLLPRSIIPTGLFWDDNDNPNDESALIAWFSPAEDAWIYGSIALDDPGTAENEVDLRLAELAAAAGVDVTDLQYTPGDTVPADVVAILEGGGVFATAGIEDLSNLNLNFSFDVGDIEAGEFTLRIAPRFAELVAETVTASQFSTAATLDLANVPFLGTLEERQPYLDLIDQLIVAGNEGEEGLAAQNKALDSMGFNFLETYTGLSFGIVQEQVYALSTPADLGRPGEATISTQGGNWRTLGNNLDAFFAISGSTGDVDPNGANLGYDFDTYSVTAGLAMHLTETLTAGIMVGYGDGDADIDNGFGKVEVDGASVAGFVQNRFANGASLRGFLGYQDLSFDSERNIFIPGNPVQTAQGDTDGSVFFAGVTGDLPIYKTQTFDFGLMAAVEYYDTEIDGFTETGAGILNLTVGDQNTDMTVARLGVRARGAFGNLRPYGHLAWATRNGDDIDVGTSLGGLLPGSTQVAGADDDWLDLGLGLVVDAGKSGQLRAEYRGAYSDDYTRNTARLSYEIRF